MELGKNLFSFDLRLAYQQRQKGKTINVR